MLLCSNLYDKAMRKNLASLKNDIFSIQNVYQVPEYVH